ncbi:MAG: hypothetical protein IJP92_04515 [Lachnospiraceae bacterium]|nr:hypothetical protein [Lachnospiraceae bacterium]
MQIMQQILAVFGGVGLVITAIRVVWILAMSNVEWSDDVSISTIVYEGEKESLSTGECVFPQEYKAGPQTYAQEYMLRPSGVIIKKMKLIKTDYNGRHDRPKRKTEKVFRNISPFRPLLISVERAETLTIYSLVWKGRYGSKAEYEFFYNGRDGNYNRTGIQYKVGLSSKLRRVIGLP